MVPERWSERDAYEAYMGRWSRRVAPLFLRWLTAPVGLSWVDVGCGTGALSGAVVAGAAPVEVTGVDSSPAFVTAAAERVGDPRARFRVGDARELPLADHAVGIAVSGLALNFVPEPARAVAEMARVTAPGGTVAAYVWDYGDGMEMLRYFWTAATTVDAAAPDELDRFSAVCRPDPLRTMWTGAGLQGVTVDAVSIPTTFTSFDDYWTPFLGGQGPAPGFVARLEPVDRNRLRDLLRSRLPAAPDGSIRLTARAWTVRGTTPA
ncbi:class I SAM-dependent methyltransferase [Asanoa sp. WMMD1127]|uniref:class I SAM-dependent methyltransferase n=1 Tax=Asanoa sp. WMMD1127 TaxID=3016107 RepID=UPI002415984A|nr:class I SAM-dependent methyltransferase [Asanoa sp. WMMD1127]MDG4824813.1 class I SAM-dependent methyltransferase [Asanoa sp. WMMD1127]